MPSFAEQMKQYFKQNAKTKEYCAHSAKVHSVAWNQDGHKLASGSYDQTASVFVLDRDRLVRFKFFSTGIISNVRFSEKQFFLIHILICSAHQGRICHLWYFMKVPRAMCPRFKDLFSLPVEKSTKN